MSFGPDYHHAVFNDGPVPIDKILADSRVSFIILKYTQGSVYQFDDWGVREGPRVRASRARLGGYHMLDGDSPPGFDYSGLVQARYFLSKYRPQPGDVVPIVDFEGAGQGGGSLATYKTRLIDFIREVHAQGFECMLYGHATVKVAFGDWRDSGADYWWVPGTSPHSDVGARGPDIWQYDPYLQDAGITAPGPRTPAGNLREDVSAIVTGLPIIALPPPPPPPSPGDDMAEFMDWHDGVEDYRARPDRVLPLPEAWPVWKKAGYKDAKAFREDPAPGPTTGLPDHKHATDAFTGGVV